MRSTFKVLFYLKKNNLNKNGEAPIMARITIDGAVAEFSYKAFIRPDLWETKFNRAVGRSEKAVEITKHQTIQICVKYLLICLLWK